MRKCPNIFDRTQIELPLARSEGVPIMDKQVWHRLLSRHLPNALVVAWDSQAQDADTW